MLCEDVSGGLESMPISFINEVDEETLPYVEYTPKNIPGQGACEDDFSDVFFPCECASCDSSCPCVQRSGQPYDDTGCIRPALTLPVIECSRLCCCLPSGTCINRVVQRGIKLNLQIFKTTKGKGFGVRALNGMKRGAYVCSYAGEVIDLDEARRRVAALYEWDPNYVIMVREGGTATVIDPSATGSVGRFLNHSCNPNLVMIPVRTESVVPELALFALRDIFQGEELCYDYSGGCPEVCSSEGRKQCSCGALNCRGWLPFDKNILGV